MLEAHAIVNMKPITSLNVIQYPSGSWGYAGHIPCEIGYIDATPEKIKAGKQFGERFGPKKRTFESREDAIAFASSKGYTVNNA